jgi:diaminohydroxyphosphoribosylaminopyrimidine deaminase/5-amino-6-(5-phosphoribosylamino)uracil reductase
MNFTTTDAHHMQHALRLARQGEGHVEPNPMVGCVIVRDDQVVGVGWHQAFGGPHAEVHALEQAGERAKGATLYVTLEPCSHAGKTPPCAEAVIAAGIARVVIARGDPNPKVAGGGIRLLQEAGLEVQTGLLEHESAKLLAPFLSLIERGRPWVIAKWAMTLDGKLATSTGDSQWISGEASREIVHALRGRVDAIMVGGGTARRDNPLLTARPPGARVPTRIVVSGSANLALDSQLAQTAKETPLLCVASDYAEAAYCHQLMELGAEVIPCGKGPLVDVADMMQQLGERQMTNVLVEGGGGLLGSLFDHDLIDELHVFIAPKLIGGREAESPIAGRGLESMDLARILSEMHVEQIGPDVYLSGRVRSAV